MNKKTALFNVVLLKHLALVLIVSLYTVQATHVHIKATSEAPTKAQLFKIEHETNVKCQAFIFTNRR